MVKSYPVKMNEILAKPHLTKRRRPKQNRIWLIPTMKEFEKKEFCRL